MSLFGCGFQKKSKRKDPEISEEPPSTPIMGNIEPGPVLQRAGPVVHRNSMLHDIVVNVRQNKLPHENRSGFGLYFCLNENGDVTVKKLDRGSEAEMAGVKPGDTLQTIQDVDGKLPLDDPGAEVEVTREMFDGGLALAREIQYCRFSFKSGEFVDLE